MSNTAFTFNIVVSLDIESSDLHYSILIKSYSVQQILRPVWLFKLPGSTEISHFFLMFPQKEKK